MTSTGERVMSAWGGERGLILADPHLLALQAALNASCVSPCHEANHGKKGQSVSKRSLQKGHKIEAGIFWVRCQEGLLKCE